MAEVHSFHAVFRGRVQGVGFRHFARQRALAHRISGFVRNLPDDSVEVRAEGTIADLAEFEVDVRRGPCFGQVDDAVVTSVEARGFSGFEIR